MILSGNRIGVEFDLKHNQFINVGGVELQIVHEWNDNMTDDQEETKLNGNVNRLEVAPQIATVTIPNPKFKYAKGDRVLCHYMAFDCKEEIELYDKKFEIIDGEFIFCKIVDEDFEMADNHYLGERILAPDVKRNGLYLDFDKKPVASQIKITHTPKITSEAMERNYGWVGKGTVVWTVDDYQYPIKYAGKEFVKLISSEIVGEVI